MYKNPNYQKEYQKTYQLKNRDRLLRYYKAYYYRNADKIRARAREWSKKHYQPIAKEERQEVRKGQIKTEK